MKKYFKFFGIALLATSLCFATASCTKDKDDDDSTEQGGGEGISGDANTITVNMQDFGSWTSAYQQFNYLGTSQDGHTVAYGGAFQQQNAWPAAILMVAVENGAQSYGMSTFNCNYVDDGEHTLTGSDGSEVKVGSYTYYKDACGDINVSSANANLSTMKATFKAVIPLVNTQAYFVENPQTIIKHMTVTYNNVSMSAFPSSKAATVANVASDVVWKLKK